MKNLLLILLFLFFVKQVNAQALITRLPFTKSIQDFGAIPNDGKDDTWAFIKAGKYFSNLWDINGVPLMQGKQNINYKTNSGKLIIPSGTYLVGRQITVPANGLKTTYGDVFNFSRATAPITFAAGHAYKAGLELMTLENVDQFALIGSGSSAPLIKYNNELTIGYFNSNAEPVWFPASVYDGKYVVSIGNFIDAYQSKNISIENLVIDGNNTPVSAGGKTLYNGGWASDGIQLGASAAYFHNTQNVSLIKLDIHRMTLDGIIFQDYYKDTTAFSKQAFSNLLISDTKCDYNRRQGFSWVGGRKLTVINSSFSQTGTTVSGVAAGNPGAGVDIEPESDGSNPLYCMDAIFTNCSFINNKGCALLNDESAARSRNIRFVNCKFHDVDGYSVWVKGKKFSFENCKIWGGFVFGNSGEIPGDETRFNYCDFADEEIPGRKGIHNVGYALVESWQVARRLLFSKCSFRTLHDKQRLAAIWSQGKTEDEFALFKDCSFSSLNGNADEVFFGCAFSGNSKFKNLGTKTESLTTNGLLFKGSNNKNKPDSFSLEGKIFLVAANSNGPGLKQFVIGRSSTGKVNHGYLNFTIGPQSCMYGYWSQQIDVGKNSQLINRGQFAMLSGTVNLEGKLTLEAGSYTAFFTPVVFKSQEGQSPEIHYTTKSNFGLSNSWKTTLAGAGDGQTLSAMKISERIKIKKKTL